MTKTDNSKPLDGSTDPSSPAASTTPAAMREAAHGAGAPRQEGSPAPAVAPLADLGSAEAPTGLPAAAGRSLLTVAQTEAAAASARQLLVAECPTPSAFLSPAMVFAWQYMPLKALSEQMRLDCVAHACSTSAAAERESARVADDLQRAAFADEQRPLVARQDKLAAVRSALGSSIVARQRRIEELQAELDAATVDISTSMESLETGRTETARVEKDLALSRSRQETYLRQRTADQLAGRPVRPAPPAAASALPAPTTGPASPSAAVPAPAAAPAPAARRPTVAPLSPTSAAMHQSWAAAARSPVTRSRHPFLMHGGDGVFTKVQLRHIAEIRQPDAFSPSTCDSVISAATAVAFLMPPKSTVADAVDMAARFNPKPELFRAVIDLLEVLRAAVAGANAAEISWPSCGVPPADPTPAEGFTIPKRPVHAQQKRSKTAGNGGSRGGHSSSSGSTSASSRPPANGRSSGKGGGKGKGRPPASAPSGSGSSSGAGSNQPRRAGRSNRTANRSDPETVSDHSLPRKHSSGNRSNDD